MKKAIIGILAGIFLIVGLVFWQGENIVDMIFYDMDATMDLPDKLYDDESLRNTGACSDIDIVMM